VEKGVNRLCASPKKLERCFRQARFSFSTPCCAKLEYLDRNYLSGTFTMCSVLTQSRQNGREAVSLPGKPLLRREMFCAIPPPSFSRENFLSGSDNGRFRLIQARSGLRSPGQKDGKSRAIPRTIPGQDTGILPESRSGLILGDFSPPLRI